MCFFYLAGCRIMKPKMKYYKVGYVNIKFKSQEDYIKYITRNIPQYVKL